MSWPATQMLIDAIGWRATYLVYAALLALLAAPLHAFALPRSRAEVDKPAAAPGEAPPTATLPPHGLAFTLVVAACLAVSALYELVEWLTAVVAGSGAVEFLGTQGDPWDTQADMLCALIGALLALLLLARLHDRQLARLSARPADATGGTTSTTRA